jgi:hypothetical protein
MISLSITTVVKIWVMYVLVVITRYTRYRYRK